MSTTRIPATNAHIVFTDPATKKRCKIKKSDQAGYTEGAINEIIRSPLYRGAMGNRKAQRIVATLNPNDFFLRYSAKVEDFVFCCNTEALIAGILPGSTTRTTIRINLRTILASSPGGLFDMSLFFSFLTKENTCLGVNHPELIQKMLKQLPYRLALCPPSAIGFSAVDAVSSSAASAQSSTALAYTAFGTEPRTKNTFDLFTLSRAVGFSVPGFSPNAEQPAPLPAAAANAAAAPAVRLDLDAKAKMYQEISPELTDDVVLALAEVVGSNEAYHAEVMQNLVRFKQPPQSVAAEAELSSGAASSAVPKP
jgi:hypothetical protein